MPGRLLFILGVLFVLACAAAFTWIAADLPPPGLVLRHGFPPAGGPTGQVVEIEGVEFVELKAGYFRMGSWFGGEKGDMLGRVCKVFRLPWGKQPKQLGAEVPVHWVEFRRPYWIARTEVTNEQYERFDPQHKRGWGSKGDRGPVTDVSWEDARAYCDWLSRRGRFEVRLPSESEWENACRAGSKTEYCFGDDETALGTYAWYGGNFRYRAREVGTLRPNVWALYDLHGNVREWVEDIWHVNYEGAPDDGRAWTAGGEEWRKGSPDATFRGGGWNGFDVHCRSAIRCRIDPGSRELDLGFRPAAEGR